MKVFQSLAIALSFVTVLASAAAVAASKNHHHQGYLRAGGGGHNKHHHHLRELFCSANPLCMLAASSSSTSLSATTKIKAPPDAPSSSSLSSSGLVEVWQTNNRSSPSEWKCEDIGFDFGWTTSNCLNNNNNNHNHITKTHDHGEALTTNIYFNDTAAAECQKQQADDEGDDHYRSLRIADWKAVAKGINLHCTDIAGHGASRGGGDTTYWRASMATEHDAYVYVAVRRLLLSCYYLAPVLLLPLLCFCLTAA